MKYLTIAFLIGGAFIFSTALFSEEATPNSHCACKGCKCAEGSHCGCFLDQGCHCNAEGKSSCCSHGSCQR